MLAVRIIAVCRARSAFLATLLKLGEGDLKICLSHTPSFTAVRDTPSGLLRS